MRLVHVDGDTLELRWMWLPTFIGSNFAVMQELKAAWEKEFNGARATHDRLEEIHDFTVDWLAERFDTPGLKEYLQAVSHVNFDEKD